MDLTLTVADLLPANEREVSSNDVPFVYELLPPGHVRLCSLFGIPVNALPNHISCRFEIHSIDNLPEYDAISYTWEGQEPSEPIQCISNDLRSGILSVSEHLWHGLGMIMHKAPSILCWIDALSINQKDEAEKKHQIPMMQKIYGNATNVVIWLGDPEFLWEQELMTQELLYVVLLEMENSGAGNSFVARIMHEPAWQATALALRQLQSKSWFRRSWVCQESIVAKNPLFLYGANLIPWEPLYEVAVLSNRTGFEMLATPLTENVATGISQRYNSLTAINTIRSAYQRKPGPAKTPYLINLIRNTQATKLADKVYCILGLLEPEVAKKIVVDYSKPYQDIYLDFARAVIVRDKTLSLLSNTRTISSSGISSAVEDDTMPSWCPDLTANAPDFFSFLDFEYLAGFEDISTQTCHVSLLPDGRHISIPGFRLGIIEEIAPLRPDVGSPDEANFVLAFQETWTAQAKWLIDIDDLVRRAMSPNGHTEAEITEATWRLHTAGVSNSYITTDPNDENELIVDYGEAFYPICDLLRQGYDVHREVMRLASNSEDASTTDSLPNFFANMASNLQTDAKRMKLFEAYTAEFKAFGRRKIFRTDNGLVGMGPTTIEKGDLACVLFDASPIFILRPIKGTGDAEGKECFRSVGDGYVHGCMELPKTPNELKEKKEEFIIG